MPKHNSTSRVRLRIAENLRRFRNENGLSQEELADKAGLHRTFVGAVERAERNISIDNVEKLALALDVSVVALVKGGANEAP